MLFAIALCSAGGLIVASPLAHAQQKTAKACQEEWRANKAANQAAGKTEKAYVTECRGTAAKPEVAKTPAAAPAALVQQKTAKACQEEWRANKAANQAAGKTEKAFVAECRGTAGKPATATTPAAAPAKTAAPAPTATSPNLAPAPASPAVAAPAKTTAPAPVATAPKQAPTPAAVNQYTTEALAKVHCLSDTVVWVNLRSKIYHFAGNKDYGNTKKGAYMCEKDTAGVGARAAKDEKHS
jgi:hypothetical protein